MRFRFPNRKRRRGGRHCNMGLSASERRLEQAKQLLWSPKLKLADVAERNSFGISPGDKPDKCVSRD